MAKPDSLIKQVAESIGVNERTVRRWRQIADYPGDAAGFDAVIEWVNLKGLGVHKNTESLTELRAEVEKEKLRKLRRENEVAEGRIVSVDTVLEINGEIAAKLALLLKTKFTVEMPPLCVGQPIAEIRAIARNFVDEICDVTTKGILEWKPDD